MEDQAASANDPLQRSEGDRKRRIERFSDGVFVVTIALLVLNVGMPPPSIPTTDLMARWLVHWSSLSSYLLSFVAVSVYWVAHYMLFNTLNRTDQRLLWLNNLFLMFVTIIVFSAALLGGHSAPLLGHTTRQIAVAIYGANLILTELTFYLLRGYASRNYRMGDADSDTLLLRFGVPWTMLSVGIYFVAALMSFVSPRISTALYWIVLMVSVLMQCAGQETLKIWWRPGSSKK